MCGNTIVSGKQLPEVQLLPFGRYGSIMPGSKKHTEPFARRAELRSSIGTKGDLMSSTNMLAVMMSEPYTRVCVLLHRSHVGCMFNYVTRKDMSLLQLSKQHSFNVIMRPCIQVYNRSLPVLPRCQRCKSLKNNLGVHCP